ncbi:PAS domain-containing sensor histidine kinase [Bacillus sp. S/N-304-OC-R1]|uniref:PAS domain-containing sensor histidine kinase n=1 Tax=Bacillus sp. S/N-304-OC-R1 TaxID=2758034 RepID=UPI001C8D115C|nr:PAS domain-containing sensor histidine kinase [Bacillus sp. S/N-304-OC-R1]MBY0121879.1 PAS domain-containing sensor histidine kinase [Bacillus sp. S/N-304-OC-R1]
MDKTGNYWEFDMITKHTHDILIIVDQQQIVRYVTPSFESILGYSPEEFVGKNAFDPIFSEDRNRIIASHREVLLTKQPRVDDYRVLHNHGEIKYLESRVMPVQDNPDQIVVVSIRDITFRKQMEKELEHRKNRYQELQNSLKNYSQDLSKVMKVSDITNRLIKELKTMMHDSQPQIINHIREINMVKGDSDLIPFSVGNQLTVGKLHYHNDLIYILLGNSNEMAYILTVRASAIKESMDSLWLETLIYYTVMVFESLNVIESLLNQLEIALQKSERPQWILRLMFNLSEKQRMELSSDLHDTVLQDQMALFRKLESILKEYKLDSEVDKQLKGIVEGLLDTIHKIRVTCNELRPPLLREMGLVHALENLFQYTQISSTYKISFTADNTEGLNLNEEETLGLYRIVQELLNNAAKHSQAFNLCFNLNCLDGILFLHYWDDGIGFDSKVLSPSFKSMGLSGIRERIRSLNGNVEFTSQPGNGLKVKMQLPISV